MRLRFLLLSILPATAFAQTVRDSVISVSVSRTTRVAPDRASLYLIVEGTAETAPDAIARVDAKLKTVTDALKAFGPRVKLDPPIGYGVGPTPVLNGYPGAAPPATQLARSVVRVQLDQPDQTARIVAAAIAAGATNSSSLSFESSAADSVRRARIAEALGVARLDAETVATSLGGRLGGLVGVNTSGGPFGFQAPTTLNFDNRFSQPTQAPDIVVTTTVTVQYKLVR
jgi:uncharacterized protein YggE